MEYSVGKHKENTAVSNGCEFTDVHETESNSLKIKYGSRQIETGSQQKETEN